MVAAEVSDLIKLGDGPNLGDPRSCSGRIQHQLQNVIQFEKKIPKFPSRVRF